MGTIVFSSDGEGLSVSAEKEKSDMEEILIVDRIENGYAVCETEQGEKGYTAF